MTARDKKMQQKIPLVKELRKFAQRHGLELSISAMNRFLKETRAEMVRKKEIVKLQKELDQLALKRMK